MPERGCLELWFDARSGGGANFSRRSALSALPARDRLKGLVRELDKVGGSRHFKGNGF